MAKTLAQKAADKQMDEAVLRMVEAYKMLPEGSNMVDYVTVIEGIGMDEEGEIDGEGYGLGFRHGNCRTSVAIGILTKGLEMLQFGGRDIPFEIDDVGD